MPFAKTNWESDPPVPNGGYFDFGHAFGVKNLTLRKADHRPCFIHVSSEVECVVTALSVVASVEVLDLYALVGPMDCFDYRHIAKLKGTPMDPSMAMFGFRIDASVIPRERVWQIQLKLSASGSQQNTIILHELAATLERAHSDGSGAMDVSLGPRRPSPRVLGNPTALGSTIGADRLSTSRSTGMLSNAAGEAHVDASLSGSHRSQRVGSSSMRLSRGQDLGSTSALLSATLGASGKPTTPIQGGGLSASRSAPSMGSSGTQAATLGTSMSSSGFSRLARDDSPPPPPRRSSKSARYSSSTSGMATKSSGHHGSHHSHHLTKSRSREMAHGGMGGGGQIQMREETAAVASVLNAVCEKMVGVVSDKTKNYLFRAGRRTERKVLDKVQRLEERIERFDQVLERSSIKKIGEIEDAVLSLDSQFKSPAFGLNSAPTAAATPTSVRAST